MDFEVDRLRTWAARADHTRPEISAWSVGQHIQHLGLAMLSICRALQESSPPVPRAKWTMPRFAVLTFRFIPRGRAEAPRVVIPEESPAPEALVELLDRGEAALKEAVELPPDAWIRHPVLDVLNRAQALRFVRIHNRHHGKIIRSILR